MALNKTDRSEAVVWENFKARAESLREMSQKIRKISTNEKEHIFKERANNLRLEKGTTTEDKDLLNMISFYIEGELFGVEVKYLQEVYEVSRITRIPCTPKILSGLINYRGSVLSIVNLRVLFGLQSKDFSGETEAQGQGEAIEADKTYTILIVEYKDAKAGIMIDQLDNLLELAKPDIQPVSTFFRDKNKIIKSEMLINNLPLLIIDPEEMLNDKRLFINEDVS